MRVAGNSERLAATGLILLLGGCAAFQAQHAGRPASAPALVPAHEPPTPGLTAGVTFSRVQDEILTPRCAIPECHVTPPAGTEDQAPEGLILEKGKSFALLVGVKSGEVDALRVAPGDPDASYLVRKVTPGAKIAWHSMPLDKPKLSDAERQLIRDWVTAGAKND